MKRAICGALLICLATATGNAQQSPDRVQLTMTRVHEWGQAYLMVRRYQDLACNKIINVDRKNLCIAMYQDTEARFTAIRTRLMLRATSSKAEEGVRLLVLNTLATVEDGDKEMAIATRNWQIVWSMFPSDTLIEK